MRKQLLSTVIFGMIYSIVSAALVPFARGAEGTPPPFQISNPITLNTFTDLLNRLIDVLLVFIGPVVLIMIGYAALLFMTSGGDIKRVKTAREVLKWTIIGLVIIILAKLLVSILKSIFASV